MALFIHLLLNWIGFTYEDEYLDYIIILWELGYLILIFCYLLVIMVALSGIITSTVAYIYKKKNSVPEDILSDSWHKLRQFVAHCFIKYGTIMYAHEIIGMENLPEGPGIIVFYHGNLDIDYVLLICNLYMKKGKLCVTVTDKGLFSVPGLKHFFQMAACMCGNKADCVEILKKGYLLGISPGGGRETIFSDHYYELLWGKRTGFAQVALEAKVPIIPMFTQNIQEAFRAFGRTRLLRWFHEKTRSICAPVYGGFPVKLRTYLGEPIPYDPNITAVELAEKTKAAIENLRDRYQIIPGNILRALSERFDKNLKDD